MCKQINIPAWLAENQELSWNAKALYAVYYYFTTYGDLKCCLLTNDEIGNRLGLKERTIQREKQKLRDAGYIKVSGIRVYALVSEETATTDRGDKNGSRGDKNGSRGDKNGSGNTKSVTHNKEKEDIKKELNNNTYIISTSIGVAEEEQQTTPIENTPMETTQKEESKFATLIALLHRGDDIETLNWLHDNYNTERMKYVYKWWEDDPSKVEELNNFSKSLAIA